MAADESTSKYCPRCKRTLPKVSFWKQTAAKDGLQGRCKDCINAGRAARYHKDIAASREKERKRKRNREQTRAASRRWYARHKTIAAARIKACRDKRIEAARARNRQYKKENPEKVLVHFAKRRARKVAAPGDGWTEQDVLDRLKAQKNRCGYCRKKLGKRFCRDHIIALAKGGAHDRTNLQILCEPCNETKAARDPIDFARSLGLLI